MNIHEWKISTCICLIYFTELLINLSLQSLLPQRVDSFFQNKRVYKDPGTDYKMIATKLQELYNRYNISSGFVQSYNLLTQYEQADMKTQEENAKNNRNNRNQTLRGNQNKGKAQIQNSLNDEPPDMYRVSTEEVNKILDLTKRDRESDMINF